MNGEPILLLSPCPWCPGERLVYLPWCADCTARLPRHLARRIAREEAALDAKYRRRPSLPPQAFDRLNRALQDGHAFLRDRATETAHA